jgi:hypothetical protein
MATLFLFIYGAFCFIISTIGKLGNAIARFFVFVFGKAKRNKKSIFKSRKESKGDNSISMDEIITFDILDDEE